MLDELSKHEQLVAIWDRATQHVEILQQLSEAGDMQRTWLTRDRNPNAEVIINGMMESGRYQLMLQPLITKKHLSADQARTSVIGKAIAA